MEPTSSTTKKTGGGVSRVREMERARAVPELNLPPTYTKVFIHSRKIHLGSLLQPYSGHLMMLTPC
ncbi:hypothetical protein I79_015005 [Cricetulus griseus]|uniref:Uncharacterized protein n=1 Tax=Cricetulus griseus TaxID=10029 RepID=G3HVM7_CRIGR|nr:hypothetical protein I79_015005 [Cricetulus griseus]